jgi:hypothetical protein
MRPGMSDGRCFTTYLPNAQMDANIQESNSISSNHAYRTFLQTNAVKFMEDMDKMCINKAAKDCDCFIGMHLTNNEEKLKA